MTTITQILGGAQILLGIGHDPQDCFEQYLTDDQRTFLNMHRLMCPYQPELGMIVAVTGRPEYENGPLPRAFLATSFFRIPTIEDLRKRLIADPNLRQICGFTTVPSAATFSRRLALFPVRLSSSVLYSVMDSAYDAAPISSYITGKGRVPLIDPNKRRCGDQTAFTPAQKQRFNIRTTVERTNSHLKDWLLPPQLFVRGIAKVAFMLLCGVLALAALKVLRYSAGLIAPECEFPYPRCRSVGKACPNQAAGTGEGPLSPLEGFYLPTPQSGAAIPGIIFVCEGGFLKEAHEIDLYGNLWDLVEFKADHPMTKRTM